MAEQVAMVMEDHRLPQMVAVTTVCKRVINPGEPLLRAMHRRGAEGVPFNDPKDRQRGNVTHGALEDLHHGRPVNKALAATHQRPFLDGLTDWYEQTQPAIRQTEVAVADKDLGINGRIDCVRECAGCPDCQRAGKLGVRILDVSTGALWAYQDKHVQVGGAYVHLYEMNATRTMACGAEILCIDPQGRFKVIPAQGTPAMFLRALAWYRDVTTLP